MSLRRVMDESWMSFGGWSSKRPNAKGKRRQSTAGAEGINKGHENTEGMALVGVHLTAQLGRAHI